ncbi:MAG: HIT family protein [Thermomicrobiales bacterium]
MSDQDNTHSHVETAEFLPSERLWTPWRMQYVGGGTREDGCVFCNRLAESDDVGSLILHRGPRTFAIMNLFPYNTGHAMILPNEHLASPEELDEETAIEMALFLPEILAATRRALGPGGFNVGMNLGSIAGAGIAAHLHQHIVPRWQGDANFMPILANTKALPELIAVTYAKIRAELERSPNPVPLVAFSADRTSVYLDQNSALPVIESSGDGSLWGIGQSELGRLGLSAFFAGWAGPAEASPYSTTALTYQVTSSSNTQLSLFSIARDLDVLTPDDRKIVTQALQNLRD